MFKRFIGAFVAVSMIASPALAGSYSSGKSYSSSSSYRSSSYSSRPSYSSGSTYKSSYNSGPSYKSSYSSSYTRPAASTPRYTSGSSYNYKPAQTAVVPRSNGYYGNRYGGNTYVNHNYSGGGGTFGSPWFWMWALDRHQAPVYVNSGGGYTPGPMQGDGGYYGAPVNNGPGFFGMIFWGIFNLIVLIGVIWFIVWIVRKLFFRK